MILIDIIIVAHSTLKVSNLHWAYNLSDIDTDYADYYSFIPSTDLNNDMYDKEVRIECMIDSVERLTSFDSWVF